MPKTGSPHFEVSASVFGRVCARVPSDEGRHARVSPPDAERGASSDGRGRVSARGAQAATRPRAAQERRRAERPGVRRGRRGGACPRDLFHVASAWTKRPSTTIVFSRETGRFADPPRPAPLSAKVAEAFAAARHDDVPELVRPDPAPAPPAPPPRARRGFFSAIDYDW